MLQPGLYEQLINQELEQSLSACDPAEYLRRNRQPGNGLCTPCRRKE